MRNRIVVKLFLLTTALCMFILAAFLIGQTLFFKKYYVSQKIEDMKTNIHSFEKAYQKNNGHEEALQQLERDFYQKHHAWVTTLDRYGNLENPNDFYLEVKLGQSRNQKASKRKIKVPLYNLVKKEDFATQHLPFSQGMGISIYGIKKKRGFIPYIIAKRGTFPRGTFGALTPNQLKSKEGILLENKVLERKVEKILDEKHVGERDTQSSVTMVNGKIKKVVQPSGNTPFIYTNQLFMKRIQTLQADLLLNNVQYRDDSIHVRNYKQNGIRYKQFIKPIKYKNGDATYIFSMVSLQPVDEAIQMFKTYSVYIIGFVFLLTILASIYYSKTIARPLLRINQTTKKIANLDFSESVPVTSKDEIGGLSRNINDLSHTLHSHIQQLQHDIEKEIRLEDTRKAFISGVSHELKTPLSIMKSCISILKDGVAAHKKDHYLQALEKEVDRVDLLVVDMLELAKFESGTYKMEMGGFYIDQAIENVCEQLSEEITKKALKVNMDLDHVEVTANQRRIEQVLTNFITNAIRYAPTGENMILSIQEGSEQVKVSVENNGAHIEDDQLDKIWDRFYRGDSSRRRSNGGTGLGLAISKNILELHGVKYGVSNTKNGVLFFFYLDKKE